MKVSVGVVVLALLGRAAGFAGIASHTARLRQNANARHGSTTEAITGAIRRSPATSWPTTAIRGGGRVVLKASDEPEAVPSSSTRPPLDVKSVGR